MERYPLRQEFRESPDNGRFLFYEGVMQMSQIRVAGLTFCYEEAGKMCLRMYLFMWIPVGNWDLSEETAKENYVSETSQRRVRI